MTVSLHFLENAPDYAAGNEYYSFTRAALRNALTDVTFTVNSAQAPLRHTGGSA